MKVMCKTKLFIVFDIAIQTYNKWFISAYCKKGYKPLHICMFQIFGAMELMLTNYKEAKNMAKFNYKMRTRKLVRNDNC